MASAKLIVSEAFHPTRHIFIDSNPFVIGRGEECSLLIERSGISRHHARILHDGEQHWIEDANSKNGTFLNGRAVSNRERLQDRDLITISGLDLVFRTVLPDESRKEFDRTLGQFRDALNFSRFVAANVQPEPILDEIMKALMRLSHADRGFLLLQQNGKMEMVRAVNFSTDEFHSEEFRISRTAVEKAQESGTSVVISNASQDSSFAGHTSVAELGLKTLICIPVLAQDRLLGMLYADSDRKEQEFTPLDVEVLESLATNAAFALENARLNMEVQRLVSDASTLLQNLEQEVPPQPELQRAVKKRLAALLDSTAARTKA